jgi:hypothetical protein
MFGKVITFVPRFLVGLNESVSKVAQVADKTDKGFTFATKAFGATSSTMGIGAGSVQMIDAVVRCDYLCATVTGVGLVADCIQLATCCLPGANMTTLATLPVSAGCKTFVLCCKLMKFPWGGCS